MGEAFPLHTAARNKDIEAMKELIAGGLTDINQIDKLKRTALHIASWAGCSDAVKLLLGSNASTELKAMDGFTALHFASQSNSIEAPQCIRVLIKKDKSLLNQRVSKGNKSALHLAVLKGNDKCVLELLQIGADVSAKVDGLKLKLKSYLIFQKDFSKSNGIRFGKK